MAEWQTLFLVMIQIIFLVSPETSFLLTLKACLDGEIWRENKRRESEGWIFQC